MVGKTVKTPAACEPPDVDPASIARAIVEVVSTSYGRHPFGVHVAPSEDGCAVIAALADRISPEFLHRIDLSDLLAPNAMGELSGAS